jgi:hypothetical protein
VGFSTHTTFCGEGGTGMTTETINHRTETINYRTETINYRRERLTRGWLDLQEDAEAGAWHLAWDPDFGEPDWPGHTYSPDDGDLPSDYPYPADSDALVEWGRKHFGP